jgi:hypothetical protein
LICFDEKKKSRANLNEHRASALKFCCPVQSRNSSAYYTILKEETQERGMDDKKISHAMNIVGKAVMRRHLDCVTWHFHFYERFNSLGPHI